MNRLPSIPLLLFALVGLTGPAWADHVILKNGRSIEGRATVDTAKKVVVVTRGSSTFTFPLADVAKIVEDETPADDARPGAKPGEVEAVVIPVTGAFEHQATAREFARALKQAQKFAPKVIVFELSSPGGRVDVARDLVKDILALEKVKTVAYVSGEHRGAYSAAAYFALACDTIYMAPGQSIGAAVAYTEKRGKATAVSEKFESAWRADWRATAEANGHPVRVALAMVDAKPGVAEVRYKGKRRFVMARSLPRMKTYARRKGYDFTHLRTLCLPGRVLTLTSKEAVDARLAKSIASDLAGVYLLQHVDAKRTRRLPDPVAAASKIVKRAQRELDRDVKALNKTYAKIKSEDPRKHIYPIDTKSRVFLDGGKMWRKRTTRCLAAIKKALSRLEDIRKQGEKNPDLELSKEKVDTFERELVAYGEKLKAEKRTKILPVK